MNSTFAALTCASVVVCFTPSAPAATAPAGSTGAPRAAQLTTHELQGTEAAGPTALPAAAAIAPPQDRPYPGEIRLSVDASDIARRIIHVHETVSGLGADPVLL